jgi:type I restriction enzyme S subunit
MTTDRDSLGALPEDWDVARFDELFQLQQGKQVSKRKRVGPNQKPFLRTRNVFWGRLDLADLDRMHFTVAEERRLALEPGDLLICEGGDIGRTAMWAGELSGCYYQNHLHRARARDGQADPRFVLYWLWYAFAVGRVYFGRGNVTTIPNLSQAKLAELPVPVPVLPEQRRIADALELVQRLLELERQAVSVLTSLKRALFRELLDCVEEVDTHELGEVASVIMGQSPPGTSYNTQGEGVPLINGPVEFGPNALSPSLAVKFTTAPTKFCEPEDLLLCVRGSTTGRTNVAADRACIGRGVAAIRAHDHQAYLNQVLVSMRDDIFAMGSGTTFKNISADQIKTLPIPVPPTTKQGQIADRLQTVDLSQLLHEQKLERLSSLLTSLMCALMSGEKRLLAGEKEDAAGVAI